MTVKNSTNNTVATADSPATSTMQLFTEVPGFTALSFATAAAFGAFSLMLPVIPLAVILTTGSDTLAGATTMVFMAVTVATQLVTNRIIRRYGYRRVMLAAAFLLGVPTLWYLVSMDTASLLLVAAVRGMGFGSLCVAQFALVAHIAPPGALGKASGIIGLFTGAAQMVGLPAGLWLSEHVGNSVVFIAGALVALAAAGLAVLIHNPAPEPVISRPEPSLEHGRKQLRMREKLRGGTLWVLAAPAVAMTTVAMGYGALSSFLPATVKDVDPVQGASFAGLLLAVVGGAQMIARYVCGVWADRVGKPGSLMFVGQGLVIASLVGMVGIISGGLPLGWLLVSATLFGCGFGFVSTEAMLEMFMRVPRGRIGQASTVWNAAFDTGTVRSSWGWLPHGRAIPRFSWCPRSWSSLGLPPRSVTVGDAGGRRNAVGKVCFDLGPWVMVMWITSRAHVAASTSKPTNYPGNSAYAYHSSHPRLRLR